ncbi:hypothetical protein HPG69_007567, partial [Diceros bicornis minor]
PLTHPGTLTDQPRGQRVSPAQPLGDQSARPRSPMEPGLAPVPSLPQGGPGQTMAGACNTAPDFLSPSGNQVLRPALGSVVTLNCTAWVVSGPHCPLPSVQWLKDGLPLGNESHSNLHEDSWVKSNLSEVLVSSVLGINLTSADDYGAFTCSIQNVSSSSFILQRAGLAGHVAAVLASLLVLLALLLAALLYVKCRLNVLLWYQDTYGEVEMNGAWGPADREGEPSADLLVNLSRCRRLVVVLSDAFLRRAWCSHSFRWVPRGAGWAPAAPGLTVPPRREGLCRLLELTRRPIFITFEGPRRDPAHPALRLLRQHRRLVTLLLWRPGSVTPSSDFWKELQLALPRKVQYRTTEGDPQTRLQDDKDPMLIVRGRVPEGRTLDPELDPDPDGDLGVRGPVFGEPLAPPQASGVSLGESRASEVDVSDLGSRNYNARTDFYCLVSEDDV